MGTKERPKARKYNSNPYEDFDNDLDDLDNLASDVFDMGCEDPSGPDNRISTRRKIERRNDLKELYSQFDDWDEIDLSNVW